MAVWPGVDFHFWRLMRAWEPHGRVWAQKISESPATNRDLQGTIISEPYSSDRAPYTEFCGYYWGDARWVDHPNYFGRTFRVPID